MSSFFADVLKIDSFPFDLSQVSMPSVTTIVAGTVTAIAVVFATYAYWVFTVWEENFSGHRLTRTSQNCPSNKQPPTIQRYVVRRRATRTRKSHIFLSCRYIWEDAPSLTACVSVAVITCLL